MGFSLSDLDPTRHAKRLANGQINPFDQRSARERNQRIETKEGYSPDTSGTYYTDAELDDEAIAKKQNEIRAAYRFDKERGEELAQALTRQGNKLYGPTAGEPLADGSFAPTTRQPLLTPNYAPALNVNNGQNPFAQRAGNMGFSDFAGFKGTPPSQNINMTARGNSALQTQLAQANALRGKSNV